METVWITFATTNSHKWAELTDIINGQQLPVRLLSPASNLPEIEETGKTFQENALLKAKGTLPTVGSDWVLGEDSGFIIPALAGQYGLDPFPGIYSNRWMTPEIRNDLLGGNLYTAVTFPEKNQGILTLMANCPNREAYYACSMALYNHKTGHCIFSEGQMSLQVVLTSHGTQGFGYDPIVMPTEGAFTDRTVAQLSMAEKNQLSHRKKAFEGLLSTLIS